MTEHDQEAGAILWNHWRLRTRLDELPPHCRPHDRAAGYSAQREVIAQSRQPIVGWKIAATSAAGQKHIGVDGPLAGPLLANRVLESGAAIPLDGNIMLVAEAEFAFKFGVPLPRRERPYLLSEVLDAVESLHPAIEVPDSRYNDFARVGAPQLIADAACACWFVLGRATDAEWRSRDLVNHAAAIYRNGEQAGAGSGANVLGDPRIALTWLTNELRTYGDGIAAGQFVTTGTCVVPAAIAPGDRIRADFGDFGSVEATLS
jgi:2-keto-4-pentenoate hydratase